MVIANALCYAERTDALGEEADHMCNQGASGEKRTYTVSEVAKILDIGKSSAYNLVKCNAFRTIRIGKTIRIPKASFDAWLISLDRQKEE